MNDKKHFNVSMFKSGLRIGGSICALINNNWKIFAIVMVLAEILGVVEEFVDER